MAEHRVIMPSTTGFSSDTLCKDAEVENAPRNSCELSIFCNLIEW